MPTEIQELPAKDVVQHFFAALRSSGPDAALEFVGDDAVFIAVLGDDFRKYLPMYGKYIGKKGARDFLHSLSESFDTQEFITQKVISEDNSVALWGKFHHIVRSTGRDFHSDWALVCEVKDGKIEHYQFYEDTAALEAAFHLPGRAERVAAAADAS